jgi:hypothetical protein
VGELPRLADHRVELLDGLELLAICSGNLVECKGADDRVVVLVVRDRYRVRDDVADLVEQLITPLDHLLALCLCRLDLCIDPLQKKSRVNRQWFVRRGRHGNEAQDATRCVPFQLRRSLGCSAPCTWR